MIHVFSGKFQVVIVSNVGLRKLENIHSDIAKKECAKRERSNKYPKTMLWDIYLLCIFNSIFILWSCT